MWLIGKVSFDELCRSANDVAGQESIQLLMLTSWCETCAQNEPFFPGMQAYSTVPKRNSYRRVSWSLMTDSGEELSGATCMYFYAGGQMEFYSGSH